MFLFRYRPQPQQPQLSLMRAPMVVGGGVGGGINTPRVIVTPSSGAAASGAPIVMPSPITVVASPRVVSSPTVGVVTSPSSGPAVVQVRAVSANPTMQPVATGGVASPGVIRVAAPPVGGGAVALSPAPLMPLPSQVCVVSCEDQ